MLRQTHAPRWGIEPFHGETCVRLAATACALERFRLAHGEYPATLTDLVPACLAQAPVDLLAPAGSSLKYRRAADGGFLLYSVGLDHVDDGGRQDPLPESQLSHWRFNENGPDLVWPAPGNRATPPEPGSEPASHLPRQ